ncbi:hypothetical protein LV779_39640 [Streptomyces thinghirensis]|nr:hypothetical protein [Streptomyces thinghirensis]
MQARQAPVYIVHFTQAQAVERAQALMSINMCTREEKERIAELIGNFRFTTKFGRNLSRYVRTASVSTTPACCPSTGGWWRSSRRPAC